MSLVALAFDNTHLRSLPVVDDRSAQKESDDTAGAGRLVGACLARFTPRPVSEPFLAAVSEPALRPLGLDAAAADRPEFLLALAGAACPPAAEPAARCVAAHQFFVFAGGTGDADSCLLGTVSAQRSPLRLPPLYVSSSGELIRLTSITRLHGCQHNERTITEHAPIQRTGSSNDSRRRDWCLRSAACAAAVVAGLRRSSSTHGSSPLTKGTPKWQVVAPGGSRLELQLDGCGPTPCAPASADGRRSLRSALWELLASEALHALGVPTVRAGAGRPNWCP